MKSLFRTTRGTLLEMPKPPRNSDRLATLVRRIMREKDLSYRDIEARSKKRGPKITATYIGMILNGTAKNLTIDKLQALANGLDVPFESVLFAAADIKEDAADAFRRSVFYVLYLKAEESSPEDKQTIYELVELLNERLSRRDAG